MQGLLLCLLLLATFCGSASALNCYQCGFIQYLDGEQSSDPAVVSSYQYAKSTVGTDTNCLLGADAYRKSRTTYTTGYLNFPCDTSCMKYNGIASYDINNTTLRYRITYRGCAPKENQDPKNTCSPTSTYFTGLSQGLLAGSNQNGSSFKYESATFCYCGSDLCNSATSPVIHYATMVVAMALCYISMKFTL